MQSAKNQVYDDTHSEAENEEPNNDDEDDTEDITMEYSPAEEKYVMHNTAQERWSDSEKAAYDIDNLESCLDGIEDSNVDE
eukprot:11385577-Karenia_brevis.AAC.1